MYFPASELFKTLFISKKTILSFEKDFIGEVNTNMNIKKINFFIH